MAGQLSVILTSGGLDSAVAAALMAQDSSLALLHFQYGQQAADAELRAFRMLCEHFHPACQMVAPLGEWRRLSNSSLVTAGHDIEDAAALSAAPAGTFVPMLTPVMLCAAAGWAYTLGAQRVVWGASLDNPGHYPDRADAVRLLAWQLVARSLPPGAPPAIEAPLIHYDKQAVAELARQLDVPVDATWSCLRGLDQPCGRCLGCAGREQALSAPRQPR